MNNKEKFSKLKMAGWSALVAGLISALLYFADAIQAIFG